MTTVLKKIYNGENDDGYVDLNLSLINLEVEVYSCTKQWVPKISLILKTNFEKITMIGL